MEPEEEELSEEMLQIIEESYREAEEEWGDSWILRFLCGRITGR